MSISECKLTDMQSFNSEFVLGVADKNIQNPMYCYKRPNGGLDCSPMVNTIGKIDSLLSWTLDQPQSMYCQMVDRRFQCFKTKEECQPPLM